MTQYRQGLLAASDLALTPDSVLQWPSLLFPRKGPCSMSRFWVLPLSSANPREAPGTSLVKVNLENQCSVLSAHRPGLSEAGPQCTLLSTFFPPETLHLFTSFISKSLWAFLKSQLWFLFNLICWHLLLYLNSSVRVIGELRPCPPSVNIPTLWKSSSYPVASNRICIYVSSPDDFPSSILANAATVHSTSALW